jgi:DNA replication and repair protein RecF
MEWLCVEGLRNVREAELGLGGSSAVIFGANGAGKTTLLEAVYLLARGRSFRGKRAGDLTTIGRPRTRVEGILGRDLDSVNVVFERSRGTRGHWVDGVSIGEAHDVVRGLSVRLVGENAQQLLEGDPALRRKFLDLNLFHVEHGYGAVWKRFRQILEQRNSWLRQGARGRPVWDEEFLGAAEAVDDVRCRGLLRISQEFGRLARDFEGLGGVEVRYVNGLPRGTSLREGLDADRSAERVAGFTRIGPQRGDLFVGFEERAQGLSRGQQKVAVFLLQLACGAVQEAERGVRSLWLLDDFWGDLDRDAVSKLGALILDGERQCLFTKIGAGDGQVLKLLPPNTRLFHVEQGRVALAS